MISPKKIFVGREKELSTLETVWRDCIDTRYENKAYVIFNSPGVGKTTLIRKFGEILEKEGRGIHFNYVCTEIFSDRNELHRSIIQEFSKMIKYNKKYIIEYIEINESSEYIENSKQDLEDIYSEARNLINKTRRIETYKQELEKIITVSQIDVSNNISVGSITSLLKRLSEIIPIFYTSDEIQGFESYKLHNDNHNNPEETALHYYSKIIKSFLAVPILLVLTGTKYHILRELGDTIGSPLKGKVRSIIISPLNNKNISSYIEKLNRITENDILDTSLEFLHEYLQTFSGGHGRTIEYTVEEFLEQYHSKYKEITDYNEFEDILTENMFDIIVDDITTDEKEKEFKKLQSSDQFNLVRQWINKGIYSNLRLGRIKRLSPKSNNLEKNRITYKMMTIGIIVQNGNDDYYITSYFHYLAFLELIIDEYENFLSEILYNKHFRDLVGGSSGFGYTFENIIMAIMIINSNKMDNFPFQICDKKIISNKINYDELELQSEIIYHSPRAANVDAIMLKDDFIAVFQITTLVKVPKSKIDKFSNELEIIREKTGKKVKGWFISLFEFTKKIDNIQIIQGKDLIGFMKENIYNKMIEIKRELN